MKKEITISIIIVHYHAKAVLFNCIKSIIASSPRVTYEILVVDNDEKIQIKNELKKLFPRVIYIKSTKNGGFGAGVNRGAHYASGAYLCMLNPDTLIVDNTIDTLYEFAQRQKNAGIVSAILLNKDKVPNKVIGGSILTPLNAIFTFSFIHKLFPNNRVTNNFWVYNEDVKVSKQITSMPLGAALIKKTIFDKVGGFDENFFLYYEDYDFNKRVEEAGYKNYVYKNAKIIHFGGKGGTESVKNINTFFLKSRFYYFKKHFGLPTALFTEMILRINKYSGLFLLIFLLSLFLLSYRLSELIPFIGDQGWFYLSARDMLLKGQIPLVGITSSHVWLHQGPYWTYMLALALWIGHFNPVAGAYLTAIIGLITIWFVYKIGSEIFSARIGAIASLIYATSPLVILYERMPYHTSFIAPLTLLLFYALYKWINGFIYGFPIIIFLLALLYNFETATFMLFPVVLLIILYGIIRKTLWVKTIANKKIILLAFFAWLIPMIPMILYDIHHGYPQTVKFAIWVVYKIATIFGFHKLHPNAPGETFQSMLPFASNIIRRIVFLQNALFAWVLLGISFINLLWMDKNYLKKGDIVHPYSMLFLFFTLPSVAYIAEKTNSDAYWTVFFPTIAFMLAFIFDNLMKLKRFFYPGLIFLLFYVGCNIVTLFQSHFLMNPNDYALTLSQRLNIARQIIRESDGKEYNLLGTGDWSEFASFTMSYEYLAWWQGHGPTKAHVPLRFVVKETPATIILKKEVTDKK